LTSLIPLFASLISVSSWKDMGAWSRVEKRKGVERRKRTIGRRMTVQRKKKGMSKEVTRRMSREWIKDERRDIWELKVIVSKKKYNKSEMSDRHEVTVSAERLIGEQTHDRRTLYSSLSVRAYLVPYGFWICGQRRHPSEGRDKRAICGR
jgi:hypothetical protein